MKRATLAPCVALALTLCVPKTARASDADPWFGPDKALHFGLSAAFAVGGYAASSIWLDTRTERAIAGGTFALSLGAGKELWDLSGHGDPSWRDFTWDVIGTSVGVALAVAGDALLSSKGSSSNMRASTQGLILKF
jgi:putative lipoprotein